jgi:hypothetical protein
MLEMTINTRNIVILNTESLSELQLVFFKVEIVLVVSWLNGIDELGSKC